MSYLISSEDPVPNSPIIRANKRVFELSSFQIGERNFGKQKQRDSHVNQQILRKICGKIK